MCVYEHERMRELKAIMEGVIKRAFVILCPIVQYIAEDVIESMHGWEKECRGYTSSACD